MSAHDALLRDLKASIIGYLEREQMRARLSVLSQEKGSIRRREEEARLHEVNNILLVINGIFHKKEKEADSKTGPSQG